MQQPGDCHQCHQLSDFQAVRCVSWHGEARARGNVGQRARILPPNVRSPGTRGGVTQEQRAGCRLTMLVC